MAAKGIDTTFLVQLEVRDAPQHLQARDYFERELLSGDGAVAVAPQVLAEFIHIVTDAARFERPLTMVEAVERAQFWWNAKEVLQVIPGPEAMELTLEWLRKFRLGRKRILDTQLAAAYHCAGLSTIVSSNTRDFHVYNCFRVIDPARI